MFRISFLTNKLKFSPYAIFYSLLFFSFSAAIAQNDHIRFNRLTINDGLSLSSVYDIYQDKKGFMWFGTEDGLNKYDGEKFRIFRPDPDNQNSLSYKWTELIFEDQQGRLWFGSKGGLSLFDPVYESFIQYNSNSDSHRLVGDTVYCLTEDKNNQLWVGTSFGLNKIDLDTDFVSGTHLEGIHIFALVVTDNNDVWASTNQGIFTKSRKDESFMRISPAGIDSTHASARAIYQDVNQCLWIGIANNLFKYDLKNKVWENIQPLDDHPIKFDQIEKILMDEEQNLWINTSTTLYKFNQEKNEIISVIRSIDSSHSLAANQTKSLHLDNKGNLWYGTFGDGVYRIDIKTNRSINFRNIPADLTSLSENAINSIFEDRGGNIWIGTFGAGINIYNPQLHKFGFISHKPQSTNTLSSNFVWSIMECTDKKLWIGTNNAGLNIYDPVTNTFEVFTHNPSDSKSISHSSVREIFQDSKKRVWIGTDGGGLNRFYPKTRHFSNFKTIPGDTSSISNNSVRIIYEDREGRLWVGTRSGLNLFDPESKTFTRYLHRKDDINSISNDFVYSAIYHDEQDKLWIGTYGGGLNCLDVATGDFEHFTYDPKNRHGISDNIVFSISEDKNGILWIGTNSGLNRFDSNTKVFQRFGIKDGLPNDVIYGILADNKQNLWLSTNHGLSRFNLESYQSKNFSANDGLQSNEFNGGAFHKGQSGLMYFGGVYGLNIIDSELSYINKNTSLMEITGMEILGSEVHTNPNFPIEQSSDKVTKEGDAYFLSKNISFANKVVLDYPDRFFSIEYAALNNSNTHNLRFEYMMEGLDNNWNDVGNRNYITFANMPHGSYNLKVRSTNSDNFQGLSEASLNIIITPPFWKTWWFYLFEFLILTILLNFIYRYLLKIRTNRLLNIQNIKINEANLKLMESESTLKQLNATKDKFLSIISHDLKNPFTSLLSISELMAEDYKNLEEDDKEQGIKRVHDSAKRIYKLLENLLTWSRAQSGKIIYEPINFSLEEIIQDCILLNEEAARNKEILLESKGPKGANAFGDPKMISTVIRNLLNNAIKFTQQEKTVVIKVKDNKGFWNISVIDQGIGISKVNLEKIFNIETKFKTEGTKGEKGTGLGLLICKEFIEKNGSDIYIESQEGKGSTFSFHLPKSRKFVE